MKKKNILALALVLLVIGIFIGIIILCSHPTTSNPPSPPPGPNDPDNPDNPDNPNPPAHEHEGWQWMYNDEEHWQIATCHPTQERNRGAHVYDNDDDKNCNTCNYTRIIPTKSDKIDFTVSEGGAAIGGFTGDSVDELIIPSTLPDPATGKDVPVVSVKDEAFKGNQTLETLKILDGITTIGKDAFTNCSNLKSIEISKTVVSIDVQAFYGCRSLERIIVDGDNPVYRSYTGCLIKKDEKCIVLGCKTSRIPDKADIVTSIGAGAFYGCSLLEKIDIPNNITSIGAEAFRNCTALTEFTCPESVTEISDHMLNGCSSLKTLTLHDKITYIGQSAFYGCTTLTAVTLPASLEEINNNTFYGCTALKDVTLNEGLTYIGVSAFRGCTSLASITLPVSITNIDTAAFGGCTKLTSIVYAGTAEQWANVQTRGGWKPEGVEVTFTPAQPDEGGTGEGGGTGTGESTDPNAGETT